MANAQRYGRKYDVNIDEDFALFKLYEEVGELAQAILIHRRKCRPEKYLPAAESKRELGYEIADVIGMTLVVSELLDIDVEKALKDKWIEKKRK